MTIAVDTETTGLDILRGDRPFLVSTFNDLDESVRLWEWPVNPHTRLPKIPPRHLREIKNYLWGEDLVFHNAAFDLRALASIGLEISFTSPTSEYFQFPPRLQQQHCPHTPILCDTLHDTQLLSHAVRSEGADGRHDLKSLAFHYLNYPTTDEELLQKSVVAARRLGKDLGWKLGVNHRGEGAVHSDYWLPAACYNHDPSLCERHWQSVARTYARKDAERTLALFYFLMGLAEEEQEPRLLTSYEREIRLLGVTYRMENAGMHIDSNRLTEELEHFSSLADSKKSYAESLIHTHHRDLAPFNVNSEQQLTNWLDREALLPRKKTAKGRLSLDAESLLDCAQRAESGAYPPHVSQVVRALIGDEEKNQPGYRTYTSAVRYLTSYRQLLLGDAVYPSFNQSGTKFTRYSCSKPNGQNISKLAVIPLRRVYGPRPNCIWLDPDYSQLELRIFAYAAQDHSMIKAFERGYDFHEFTACKMFSCTPAEVTKEQRRFAKATNFKAIYGGLNNVPPIYAEQFPAAAEFMAKVTNSVERLGYVYTLQGDRIYIDPQKAYVGVDAICQGTAGRIVKDAMLLLHERGIVDWEGSAMVANIHDEIIFEVALDYPLVPIAKRIKQIMEEAGTRAGVVAPVDFSYTLNNWADTTPLKKLSDLRNLSREKIA